MYDFVEAVKQAAVEAVESKVPMRFCFGRVSKVDPLEIWIDQKLTVPESALILTGMVAEGTTTVGKLTHLDRGYYQFHEKLAKLGANISRVSEA